MEIKKLIKSIKRKMVEGHDDFRNYYCIEKDDWNKLEDKVKRLSQDSGGKSVK